MNPDGQSPESARIDELTKEVHSLREQLKNALAENERLRKLWEEALRSLKRQAAPFSKGKPKKNPDRPGRKAGKGYGNRAFRAAPDRVDEKIPVALPKKCDCGGRIVHDDTQPQFQEDIVRQTIVRRFDVEIGHCARMREACSGATTRCKLPMPWERPTCSWVRKPCHWRHI